MSDAAPVLPKLGYDWDPQVPFQVKEDSTLLCYTFNNPPPIDLVERLKEVAAKYDS